MKPTAMYKFVEQNSAIALIPFISIKS